MAICVGMSSGCLLYFIVAINKKVPPWYAVLTGSVVDSDDAKIDIFVQMWGKKYRFGQDKNACLIQIFFLYLHLQVPTQGFRVGAI